MEKKKIEEKITEHPGNSAIGRRKPSRGLDGRGDEEYPLSLADRRRDREEEVSQSVAETEGFTTSSLLFSGRGTYLRLFFKPRHVAM